MQCKKLENWTGMNIRTNKFSLLELFITFYHLSKLIKFIKQGFLGSYKHCDCYIIIYLREGLKKIWIYPSFAATHHCHQPLMYPTATTHGGYSGGCWWWMASVRFNVVGVSSGCWRLAVVSGVCWQWWVLQWWGVAIADADIGCYLNQCLIWPPPKKKLI